MIIVKVYATNGIVIVNYNGVARAKCWEYDPVTKFEGYKRPIHRTAKQSKPIMGFKQSY